MDNKKVMLIGGAIIVGGIGIMLYRHHVASVASQNDSAANDAQLAALMMQQPLSYSQPTQTAATVDTGNAQLQQLLDSILGSGGDTSQNNNTSTGSSSVTGQPIGNQVITTPNSPPVIHAPSATPIVGTPGSTAGLSFNNGSSVNYRILPLRYNLAVQ